MVIPREHVMGLIPSRPIWELVTIIACSKSRYSCTPWVDEKTGARSNVWPKDVSWKCTVLYDCCLFEWILDFADDGKSWRPLT
jgi:hypothetical protein